MRQPRWWRYYPATGDIMGDGRRRMSAMDYGNRTLRVETGYTGKPRRGASWVAVFEDEARAILAARFARIELGAELPTARVFGSSVVLDMRVRLLALSVGA